VPAEEVEKIEFRGLCQSCALASTCTFPRSLEQTITSCDEFTGIRPKRRPMVTRRPSKPEAKPTAETLAGLCRYCERAADCTFPKPASGVWHCDEYK